MAQIREEFYATYPDMKWLMITSCAGAPEYTGLRVSEIAALRNQDEFQTAIDLVRISKNDVRSCFFYMCEEDVETVIAHSRAMICTDSSVAPKRSAYHPRLRAAFPRAIARYVRERSVVSLPEMIRKMTAMPAAVYGFQSKGLLREGMDADICVFHPDKLQDRADFTDPTKRCEGLSYVIVGGKIAAVNAVATGELGGTLLPRNL